MRVLSFLNFLVLMAYVASYSFYVPAKMGLHGVCLYHGMRLQPGDNQMIHTCQNLHCNEDGSIMVEGCGHYHMHHCHVMDSTNVQKPYPQCCQLNFMCHMHQGEMVHAVSPLERLIYHPFMKSDLETQHHYVLHDDEHLH